MTLRPPNGAFDAPTGARVRFGPFLLVQPGEALPAGEDALADGACPCLVLPVTPAGAAPRPVLFGALAEARRRFGRRDLLVLSSPDGALPTPPALPGAPGGVPLDGAAASLVAGHMLALARLLPEAGAADLPLLAEATLALLRACLPAGPAAPDAAAPGLGMDVARRGTRARVERVILDNLSSARLDTARICQLAGISRSALYRLFEREGGVAAHVRTLRLEKVHADLSDPALADLSIAAIAERSGLFCTTSFNRAFRRAFGRTPGEVRTGARGASRWPHRPAEARPCRGEERGAATAGG